MPRNLWAGNSLAGQYVLATTPAPTTLELASDRTTLLESMQEIATTVTQSYNAPLLMNPDSKLGGEASIKFAPRFTGHCVGFTAYPQRGLDHQVGLMNFIASEDRAT
ncbi:MAG: hypothetical protein O3A00_21435 [Planctomycetota bacterium]|nr:hypothetical protein [Planctomycetota bacterium]